MVADMSITPRPNTGDPVRNGTPRHFHLLWDDDLDELRRVLTAL